jgi:tetratricopeptide (TPR) repeat protein
LHHRAASDIVNTHTRARVANTPQKRSFDRNATLVKEKMRSSADTGGSHAAAAAQPGKSSSQLDFFEQAMRQFHARKFREARELFAKAAGGPDRAVAHKAQLHVEMCDRRLEQRQLDFENAEDHYNYAIAQINARNLSAAQHHLQHALEQDSGGDHIHFALALCLGLSGDLQGAHDHLKRAIEIQPRNRIAARQDSDFASIAAHPAIEQLLYPEKS